MKKGFRHSKSIALANYYADTRNVANFQTYAQQRGGFLGIGAKADKSVPLPAQGDITTPRQMREQRGREYAQQAVAEGRRLGGSSALAVRQTGMESFDPYDMNKGYGWRNRGAQVSRKFNRLGMAGKAGVVGAGLAGVAGAGALGYNMLRGGQEQ